MPQKLDHEEVERRLEALDGWMYEVDSIKKKFEFQNFAESLDFVNRIGAIAEARDHHPDISFGWGYCDVTVTTHDAGGVTEKDIALAAVINELM